MGKMVICSGYDKYTELEKLFDKNFSLSFHRKEKDLYVSTYYKLRMKNQNYFENDSDFIMGTGTFIYGGGV